MPKRRTTRKAVAPKAVDENTDPKIHSDREDQKRLTLYEFDANVAAALKDMKKLKRSAELAINKHFDSCISAIPSELRLLTLKEFAEYGGTFEKALMGIRKSKLDKLAGIQSLKCTAADLNLIEEESEFGVIKDVETVQRTVKKKKVGARALRTPAITTPYCSKPLKTPAITPKFNPKLPVTPENIREIMPGERLMSMAGTPVRGTVSTIQRATVKTFQRGTVARHRLEENLKESGVDLTPTRMEKILESLAAAINVE